MSDTDRQWWRKEGYLAGKPIGSAWVCLAEQITTWRIMVCSREEVYDFWCYPKELGLRHAWDAYEAFDGRGDPPEGWVKHYPSGRRRNVTVPS